MLHYLAELAKVGQKRETLWNINLLSYTKRGKEILIFGDNKIEKKKFFYCNKTPILLKDVHIDKVLVSNKISLGEKNYKYFTGYLYNDNKVKPLHIMLSRASAYIKSYDKQSKWMYSLIEDD